MGVFTHAANPTSVHLAGEMCGYAGKMEEAGVSRESSQSTKSTIPPMSPASVPAYGNDESFDDDAALEMMGPPALNRLTTDEQFYPSQASVEAAYPMGMVQEPNGLPLDGMMQQDMAPRRLEPITYHEVPPMDMQSQQPMPAMQQNNSPEVDMNNTMQPAPVSPTNNTMMYSDVMMQQAMQQAMQQGQMQWMGQHGGVQYVPVPTPVPVQMMPQMVPQMVPVPVPMNFQVPGQMQMPYYMMQQGTEQPMQQQGEEAPKG